MDEKLFTDAKLLISTDGGARGNPGPAAIGYIVGGRRYGEVIGNTTNNVAEYKAVIAALKKAKQLLGKTEAKKTDVELRLDSELIYKQIGGQYKILEPELQTLFIEAWNLIQDFKSVTFKKIPREENKEADKMVNQALDGSPIPSEDAPRLL
ncbi:MAG: ribonuclease HI family protein [Patescibacteria group bacterium]